MKMMQKKYYWRMISHIKGKFMMKSVKVKVVVLLLLVIATFELLMVQPAKYNQEFKMGAVEDSVDLNEDRDFIIRA